MYAAAGGASLASRQARQKQKKQKNEQLHQKTRSHKATDIASRAPHSRQYHNYTDPTEVKTSRVDRNVLRPPSLQPERRHSTSHLKEPSRARIRESPSVLIPVQNHLNQLPQQQPLTPSTLVQEHAPLQPSPSLQSQLPQITIPEGERTLERRCSFVRQVEEMEKGQEDLLDKCNHLSNFEVKDLNTSWENDLMYYSEFHRGAFGSTEYPFSEGRAAWQERQAAAAAGGRRCSLSHEAQQHRQRQAEAHHRWIKRNRIHDTTYGGDSEDDLFSIYHQSAAANALLYVGLGTTAIGFVVFFVGSGDKGFKTLELRLIGPTLIACGLLCCLVRVLLCACPSTCLQQRRKKKKRLKNTCPHRKRFPSEQREKLNTEFVPVDPTQSLISKQKKRVSIAPPKSLPSTSTSEHLHNTSNIQQGSGNSENSRLPLTTQSSIPIITVPEFADFNNDQRPRRMSHEDTCIELENLEFTYDLQSVSSNDEVELEERDRAVMRCSVIQTQKKTQLNEVSNKLEAFDGGGITEENDETCLTVVIEKNQQETENDRKNDNEKKSHSGIVLSPLQLGQ
ncbi:uncharacterized protein LOC108742486 isoform X2 [Agrilus planipennis]|uniref:Uncharacterized protein LOC108742486 isoform X2 n=1 Tax=Agrilus planipennis TaxID=224129 RepID=A0A1W4XL75_AGRPL|nr:uncharacterized protein LOC108742486 isoform X2 [Agrilus planipennis]